MMRAKVVRVEMDKGGVVQDTETQFSIAPNKGDAIHPQQSISSRPPYMFGNESFKFVFGGGGRSYISYSLNHNFDEL